MIKIDPIIAVKDIKLSSAWYQKVFNLKSNHGGDTFEILVDNQNSVVLCLHAWGDHEHPTMIDTNITPGNGLIFYFRTDNLIDIREKVIASGSQLENEIHINPNTQMKECAFRDLDGYYLLVSEFHNYGL